MLLFYFDCHFSQILFFFRNCICWIASSNALSVSSEIVSALFFIFQQSSFDHIWHLKVCFELFQDLLQTIQSSIPQNMFSYLLLFFLLIQHVDISCEVLAQIWQQGSSCSWQNNIIGIPWWRIHTSPLLWFGTKCVHVISISKDTWWLRVNGPLLWYFVQFLHIFSLQLKYKLCCIFFALT